MTFVVDWALKANYLSLYPVVGKAEKEEKKKQCIVSVLW